VLPLRHAKIQTRKFKVSIFINSKTTRGHKKRSGRVENVDFLNNDIDSRVVNEKQVAVYAVLQNLGFFCIHTHTHTTSKAMGQHPRPLEAFRMFLRYLLLV